MKRWRFLKWIKFISVGQLVEKGYKVLFENKSCTIEDVYGKDIFPEWRKVWFKSIRGANGFFNRRGYNSILAQERRNWRKQVGSIVAAPKSRRSAAEARLVEVKEQA